MAIKAGCGGNAGDGLCCRTVIEAKRVFDGCTFSDGNTTLTLTAEGLPVGARFITARVSSASFEAVSVSRSENGKSAVCGDAVTVFAVDYAYGGTASTVSAVMRERRRLLLSLPENGSVVPYGIEVSAYMGVAGGAIISSDVITVNGCFWQAFKVTAPVDILVPSYGYCKYPPCADCACRGISDRIFPVLAEETNR